MVAMVKAVAKGVALASAVAFTSVAAQADGVANDSLKDPQRPAPFSWTGLYAGVSGGGGLTRDDPVNLFTDSVTPTNFGDAVAASRGTIGPIGDDRFGFFGGQIGYNFQSGQIVVGVEADVQRAKSESNTEGRFTNPNGFFPIAGSASFSFDWFGTLRARFGVAMANNLLIYGTGGFAFGKTDFKVSAIEVGADRLFQADTSDTTRHGYVIGGGAEYAFNAKWSLKGEYQYINFGKLDGSAPVAIIATGGPSGETASIGSVRSDFQTVRVGINYKF